MRVIAAMSGGVDSSVVAARLVDAGHDVVGVHLALAKAPSGSGRSRGCCTLDDARDARRVADTLGIPFYVWDLSDRFREDVIDDFVEEYRNGRTPNPCVRCNERIKFAAVLDRAVALDFDAVATGHYARVVEGERGPELHRGLDPEKDQSYVLGVLSAWQLQRTLLPIGGDQKAAVRQEAQERGLLVARKPDSHDICFIPDGDTAAFVRSRVGSTPGSIVDVETGVVLGTHQGAEVFTIGQRRGLGLTVPAEDGEPRYVVDVDVATSTVRVGPAGLLEVRRIEGSHLTWTGEPLGASPRAMEVQVRAHSAPVPAVVHVDGERVVIDVAEPIRGLAAGQTAVLYDGSRVVGSAVVEAAQRAVAT
jgi:tRNA-specific 2-thiouridylase